MAAGFASKTAIILITGEPGVGKTTLMKNVVARLHSAGVCNIKGFITQEVRNQRRSRIGFDVIDLSDDQKRASLARVDDESTQNGGPRVGKYVVTLQSFENIALPIVNNTQQNYIYAIDEIGKMELLSSRFKNSIREMIHRVSSGNFILFATVPTTQSKLLDVVDQLKQHPNATMFTVTHQNRNSLVDEIVKTIHDSSLIIKA